MPFTASILQRDFLTVYDQALLLGGASFVRTLSYGGTWSRIRLGALVALTPNTIPNNIVDGVLLMGLCSGTQYPASHNNTQSAIGFSFVGSPVVGSARTFSYSQNGIHPIYNATSGVGYRKTFAGYQVTGSGGAFSLPLAYTGQLRRRYPLYVDITRNIGGGGTVSITPYGVSQSGNQTIVDYRPDHFMDGLDQLGAPTICNTLLTSGGIVQVVMGDELGLLDTFELFWSLNRFPLEIYALGAVVINTCRDTTTNLVYDISGGGLDNFRQYAPDLALTQFNSYGTGFSDAGTIYGYSAGTTIMGLTGTSGLAPYDTFEQYTTGSVISGATLNAGTGWTGYGTIY